MDCKNPDHASISLHKKLTNRKEIISHDVFTTTYGVSLGKRTVWDVRVNRFLNMAHDRGPGLWTSIRLYKRQVFSFTDSPDISWIYL